MKYRVSHLPNTGKAVKYKIQTLKGDKQSFFIFSHKLIDVWGNPLEFKLKELMIAYIKRHGWNERPVEMDDTNSPRSLNCYIADLPAAKK